MSPFFHLVGLLGFILCSLFAVTFAMRLAFISLVLPSCGVSAYAINALMMRRWSSLLMVTISSTVLVLIACNNVGHSKIVNICNHQ